MGLFTIINTLLAIINMSLMIRIEARIVKIIWAPRLVVIRK